MLGEWILRPGAAGLVPGGSAWRMCCVLGIASLLAAGCFLSCPVKLSRLATDGGWVARSAHLVLRLGPGVQAPWCSGIFWGAWELPRRLVSCSVVAACVAFAHGALQPVLGALAGLCELCSVLGWMVVR